MIKERRAKRDKRQMATALREKCERLRGAFVNNPNNKMFLLSAPAEIRGLWRRTLFMRGIPPASAPPPQCPMIGKSEVTDTKEALAAIDSLSGWCREVENPAKVDDGKVRNKGGRTPKWKDALVWLEKWDAEGKDAHQMAAKLHSKFGNRPEYQEVDAAKVREILYNAKRSKKGRQ
jgi:hypothetical protein